MKRIGRAALDILRLTFARDALGASPPPAPATSRPAPARFLRAVFAPERLAVDPEPPAGPRARSLVQWLLAPEPLPRDPEPAARPRRGRLAALFAPEKLDDSDSP